MIVGKQVIFEVIFKPLKIQRDIRYKNIPCYVNEGEYPPLLLTLTGTCTGTPTVRDICNFQTHVRHKETKNLIISNKTNQLWELRPIIDGIYWQGPLKFVVEPQASKAYEITYKPMRMTGADGKKHTGSILFPLPDGTGIFYNLFGIADPPKPVDKIIRDIPYKTKYTELLPVYNWSKQTISFNVKREVYKADKVDPTTTITGLDYIDVPAGCQKNYKLDFHAYKEGISSIKVIFTHLETGEYQFYELTLRSIKSGSLGNIELVTPVRSSIRHTVKLENPLTIPAHFNFNTNVSELMIPASAVCIPEQSDGEVTIEYQPIKIGEVTGKLELLSTELGNYLYELNLKATPASYEKSIYMQTSLGLVTTQVARFINYSKQKTDYLCKVDNPDFHVDKSIPAASASSSGTEISFDVSFEPSRLGEQRAILTASSAVGGEYIFPLFGTCGPPKPQGPFTIKSGSNIFITFRNIFNTATSFKFQVDDDRFILSKKKEAIRAHKDYRISVAFDNSNLPVQTELKSKLIVSCPHVTADTANLQWLFYLKGISL
ncbi:Hypothetical predicted protein [Octopus vulgaris]|uniref:Hydrocephalus-inducing protein homolog n=1 Tax=Octopus vulgaris TaxID=6645 RepID=A0AA36EXN0_OCTVU|nr:Hypothetical predicted protein [Octopus vulgaris]